MKALVVTNPFGTYAKGEHITDPEKLAEILAGPSSGSVVTVNLPEAAAPPKVVSEQTP